MSQPEPTQLRADLVAALDEASRTHPCTCGSTIWSSCFHPNVPTHSERRADAVLAVVQPELDAKDTEIAQALADRTEWDRIARVAITAQQGVGTLLRELTQRGDNAERDRDQARHQAALRTPLICADERHRAKVAALEAEVRGLEETAAERQQNADHWKEHAEAAEAKVTWLAASHSDGLDLIIQLGDERDRLREQLDDLRATVDLIRRADISSEQILLCLNGEQITIAVNVSDVFAWGCADAEDITPERLPVLEQAWLDCKAVDADEWTAELYAARVRGMRPQGAAYPKEGAVAALFDACGPERPTGLGNPRKAPAATPKDAADA